MPDSLLEPGERAFLEALDALGVPFMIIGAGAAVMQGAPLVTQDIDIWFHDRTDPRLFEPRNGPEAYSYPVISA